MIDVATLAEMCQILKIDHTTGAKHWRKWPHFLQPTAGTKSNHGSNHKKKPRHF